MKSIRLGAFDLCAPVNAKEISQELNKLGEFTSEEVVEAAKDPSSPLHKYFDWDDYSAAKKFRLTQARHLVLAIGFENESGEKIRQFESVVIDDRRVYVSLKTISKSEELVEQVLVSALRELSYWKLKHQRYQTHFGSIFDVITKAEEAYRRKSEKGKEAGSAKRRNKNGNTTNQKAGRKHNDNRRFTAAR